MDEKELLYCIKVPLRKVQSTKQELIKSGLFIKNFKLLKEKNYVYLPIEYHPDTPISFSVERKLFIKIENKIDYHSILLEMLPRNLHKSIPSSFDRVGDLILIKLDPAISSFKFEVGEVLLNLFKVKSVFNKLGDVESEFRTIPWECIAGQDDSITIHKMQGLRWKVDIRQVYFNTRLSNEYLRVAEFCTDGDIVIDMFAGIGPFSIMIASKYKVKIFALDINPIAIELLQQNIELNKKFLVGTIDPICGDSSSLIHQLPKANKIIMNLPGKAIDFLELTIDHLELEGTIFLHQFIHLSKEEKKDDLMLQTSDLEKNLRSMTNKKGEKVNWNILGEILRDVSPSKTHVVWKITKGIK